MKKNRAMRRLIYMAIVVLIGILLCSFGFNIPFTTHRFNGFYNGALKSNELTNGLVVVYSVERSNLDSDFRKDIDSTKSIIEEFFGMRNQSIKVTRIGDSKLQVEAGALSQVETMLNNIGSYKQLNFRASASGEKKLLGSDVKSITVERNTSAGGYGAYFAFTDEGKDILNSVTTEAVSNGESLYIFGGEDGETQLQTISLSSAITDGVLFLSGDMNTYEETQQYISQFINGILPVKLSLESSSYVYLSEPGMDHGLLILTILVSLAIVGSIVYISLKYRDLGLVTGMSLLSNFVLTFGITSSISIVQYSFYGVFALALSYFAAFVCNYIMLEKMRKKYATGKKLPYCFKTGLNENIIPTLDINILPVLFGLFLLLVGNLQVKSFGLIIAIGFAINLFTTLLLTRGLVNTYLQYNSTKAKAVNFKKEGNVDELA